MKLKLAYPPISPTLSFWLDVVRGASALIVLLGHARERLFGTYSLEKSGMPEILIKVFYVLFGMGTQAVMCFFLISGLLIAPRFFTFKDINSIHLTEYFISRGTRIYAVAAPALILSMIFAYSSIRQFGGFETVLSERCEPTLTDLAKNLAFLSKAFYPVICSNDPYWSIHNEVFYYILFPLLIIGIKTFNSIIGKLFFISFIVIILFLITFDSFDYHNTLLLFPIWILGGLTMVLPTPRGGPWLWGVLSILSIIIPNLLPFKNTWLIEAYLIAVCLSLFLRSVMDSDFAPNLILKRIVMWLANISFSLYLTHIFLINYIRQFGISMLDLSFPFDVFSAFSISFYILVILISISFAHIFYLIFERNTSKFRSFVQRIFFDLGLRRRFF